MSLSNALINDIQNIAILQSDLVSHAISSATSISQLDLYRVSIHNKLTSLNNHQFPEMKEFSKYLIKKYSSMDSQLYITSVVEAKISRINQRYLYFLMTLDVLEDVRDKIDELVQESNRKEAIRKLALVILNELKESDITGFLFYHLRILDVILLLREKDRRVGLIFKDKYDPAFDKKMWVSISRDLAKYILQYWGQLKSKYSSATDSQD